ncbi:MAG TPA: hypothetical protein VN931_12545 [Fibrobacteria bacterium]|nr:hypothetical protein [Fibrobacteria bacterium]
MAAKEEALVLKYLKKNPGTEAMDVAFGTDLDEAIVKETLQQLLSKRQVLVKVDAQGVSTWVVGDPSKSAPVSRPIVASESTPPASFDRPAPPPSRSVDRVVEESEPSSGGTGKGFVFFIVLLFALISVGASWYLAGMQIQAAKSSFDLQLKTAEDSVGFYKITTNQQLDAIRQDIKKLQAPPAPAPEEKVSKKAEKKSKKGKKHKK